MKMAVTICVLFLTVLAATVSNADVSTFASAGSFGLNSAQATSNRPFRMQMPRFPPLPWPSNFPFPKFNTIKPLTVESIAAQGRQPGSHFNGVALISHRELKPNNGKLEATGGSTVVINDNGKIIMQQSGDEPPPISIIQMKEAPFADFQQPEFEEFDFNDDIKKPDFNFPKFDSFNFKPIDEDRIKSYVPESNEKFEGNVYSFNSHSSDVNGVKKSDATFTTLNNDNGKVIQNKYDFHNGPH